MTTAWKKITIRVTEAELAAGTARAARLGYRTAAARVAALYREDLTRTPQWSREALAQLVQATESLLCAPGSDVASVAALVEEVRALVRAQAPRGRRRIKRALQDRRPGYKETGANG